jgi:hypothetical protein
VNGSCYGWRSPRPLLPGQHARSLLYSPSILCSAENVESGTRRVSLPGGSLHWGRGDAGSQGKSGSRASARRGLTGAAVDRVEAAGPGLPAIGPALARPGKDLPRARPEIEGAEFLLPPFMPSGKGGTSWSLRSRGNQRSRRSHPLTSRGKRLPSPRARPSVGHAGGPKGGLVGRWSETSRRCSAFGLSRHLTL